MGRNKLPALPKGALSALLRGTMSNYHGDFYCLN